MGTPERRGVSGGQRRAKGFDLVREPNHIFFRVPLFDGLKGSQKKKSFLFWGGEGGGVRPKKETPK